MYVQIFSSGLVELQVHIKEPGPYNAENGHETDRHTYIRTYHVEDLGLFDLLQNSSTSVWAELSRVTNVEGEGSKVLYLNGTTVVQLSHALIL